MKTSRSTLAVGLLLSVALPAGAALASDAGEQLLLERANYWRAQHRLDLAQEILNKLLSLNPGQPDALFQQASLALEQGNRGDAQQYFDRLRQLARSDSRAAELLTAPVRTGATPTASAPVLPVAAPAMPAPPFPAVQATLAAIKSRELVAASADSDDLLPEKPAAAGVAPRGPAVAVDLPAPPPSTGRAMPKLILASADSDDLIPNHPAAPARIPAPPSPHGPVVATLVETRIRQIAALPSQTVSDGDTPLPTLASAGSADLGITARAVQVVQVELEAPLPVGGYQQAVTSTPYSPTDTLQMDIDRSLAQLEQQSNPMLIAGLGVRAHSGDDGLNRLTEVGIPIQGSFSPWYTGTASIAILPVYLDAGSVGTSQLGQFGANPILAAAGLGLAPSGQQDASGVGLLGGYSWGDFSGQFGTTPIGFPVTNFVGLVSYTPKFFGDLLSIRFEGARQPVTDSVLSYAGTHANLAAANVVAPGAFGSNPTWGGVVKTGGHVTAFYDDQMIGGYAGAGLAWLTGTNVAQNGVVDALIGAYFRPFKTDNWSLRVGVSLYYTGYDKNLSGFTFGQGGYFSPQDYEALTFPIEYTGHYAPWSWLASAALGVQHFNAHSSAIFPNNPNAQIALETLSPSTAFFASTHATGPAFNIKGQLEYAIDNTLTLGAAASLDNGNNYTEGIGKLYLRKTFDWFAPVAAKDDPQSIAARDVPMSRL